MAQRKPAVRYDRILEAIILFLLFIIVLIWIFGDKKEKAEPVMEEASAAEETTEPPKTVFLSPSNQKDNEYAAGDTTEADAMRKLSGYVRAKLERNGIIVYEADESITLKEKVASANDLHTDAYVAIHSNAGGGDDEGGSGTECFYNPDIDGSKVLAEFIYNKVAALTPTEDRGLKDGTETSNYLYEIDKANTAICLIEVEFHDSEEYAQWILDNMESLSLCISDGIMNYLDTRNPAEEPQGVTKPDGE